MKNKQEVMSRMREVLSEYNELKEKLAQFAQEEAGQRFETTQRARLAEFKQKYTVEAKAPHANINWDKVEEFLFSKSNLEEANASSSGWVLGWDETGMPGLALVRGEDVRTFMAFAYDEMDGKRYVEREARREELARKKK